MIPLTYDFNETYGVLPVYNQKTSPTCVGHARTLMLDAMRLMYDNKKVRYNPTVGEQNAEGFPFRHDASTNWRMVTDYTLTFQTPDGPMVWVQPGDVNCNLTGDHRGKIKHALWRNGVLEVGVASSVPSFYKWSKTHLPLIWDRAKYTAQIDHDVVAVGYTLNGVIVQNSWGEDWGDKGRAVIQWRFIRDVNHCDVTLWGYEPHPVNGLHT